MGFINQVNDYVRSKGLTTRVWNDNLPVTSTVPLATDIAVEYWLGTELTPDALRERGHDVVNLAYGLYNIRGKDDMDPKALYEQGWSPQRFDGENNEIEGKDGVLGAKMGVWPDFWAAETPNEVEAQLFMPLRVLAQRTWGAVTTTPSYEDFVARSETIGRAAGWAADDRTPLEPGTYTVAAGQEQLGGDGVTEGAEVRTGATPQPWSLEVTDDEYYRLRTGSGLCVQAPNSAFDRQERDPDLVTPGTALLTATCADNAKTQRWEMRATGDGTFQLINGISQMGAVARDGVVRQQPPDTVPSTAWTLTPATG
ncbi:hypothetical protein AFB00_07385 [Pseudonocardia sp. HH130630-07]|nr:RICIN domain-containing protein [Pseudonocardia sp. HH130630-07]ANY06149.1 hypothetical protein AFB00_07385 [Pseudonocardia sp. HH130630-07]